MLVNDLSTRSQRNDPSLDRTNNFDAELLDYRLRRSGRAHAGTSLGLGSVFLTYKSLMTGHIVLEGTTGEHLRQKLPAMDDLLRLRIVVELALRHA